MIDFALAQTKNGMFDLVIENQNISTTEGLNTSILTSLLTDGLNENATTREQTKGFWGNLYLQKQNQYGNLAYAYLRNATDTNATLASAQLGASLQWLKENGYAYSIDSVGVAKGSTMEFIITLTRNTVVGTKTAMIWKNTFQSLQTLGFSLRMV